MCTAPCDNIGAGGGSDNDENDGGQEPADTRPKAPWIEELTERISSYMDAECVDGEDLRYNNEDVGGEYAPWPNLTQLLVHVWAILTRPSRKSLQILLDLLRYQDPRGCRFNPEHVPRSSEHLIARGRKLLPLLKVLRRKIKDKDGHETQALEIPYNLLLQRFLQSPAAVEEMLSNLGGHVMSTAERQRNGVPHPHVTPQATNNVDGAKEGFMNGNVVRSSNHMSLECVETSTGFRLMVGDTAMANVTTAGGADTVPCRIAAVYWQKKKEQKRSALRLAGGVGAEFWDDRFRPNDDNRGDESGSSPHGGGGASPSSPEEEAKDEERLVVRLNRLVSECHMPATFKSKRRREPDGGHNGREVDHVWEKTNDPVHVGVEQLVGPCVVIPADDADQAAENLGGSDGMPTYLGAGFVKFTSDSSKVEVLRKPWRQEGLEGWYMNRRGDDCYENEDGDPVFSSGIVLSRDGFNYWSLGGKTFNVEASYVSFSCLSPSLYRKLRSWFLVVVGMSKGRWEEEIGPFLEIVRHLERGCRAKIKTGDGREVTVGSEPCAFPCICG